MILNMNGGGATLNFRIVGGTATPANPQENTIWVNTANTITGWALAFAEPSEPKEGMVWISICASGYNIFNALKKHTLAVAPMAAKQYVNGAWVSRGGKIYIDQEWKDFVLWLVQDGKSPYTLTAVGKGLSNDSRKWDACKVVFNDDSITISGTTMGHGIAYIADIDLTNLKTLTIEGSFVTGSNHQLAVWSELETYIDTNLIRTEPLSSAGVTMNVFDLKGIHTVGITSTYTNEQNITNFYLT